MTSPMKRRGSEANRNERTDKRRKKVTSVPVPNIIENIHPPEALGVVGVFGQIEVIPYPAGEPAEAIGGVIGGVIDELHELPDLAAGLFEALPTLIHEAQVPIGDAQGAVGDLQALNNEFHNNEVLNAGNITNNIEIQKEISESEGIALHMLANICRREKDSHLLILDSAFVESMIMSLESYTIGAEAQRLVEELDVVLFALLTTKIKALKAKILIVSHDVIKFFKFNQMSKENVCFIYLFLLLKHFS
jgi:hypothetical protein